MNYDIKLEIGSDDYNFMLSKPEGTGKQLSISEVGPPNVDRLVSTDQFTHSDFPPDVDAPFVQTSWRDGIGQILFDNNKQHAYLWSTGIVTHADGKAYLAPPVTEIDINGPTGDTTPGAGLAFGRGDSIKHFASWWNPETSIRYDWLSTKRAIWRRDTSTEANEWEVFVRAASTISDSLGRKFTFYRDIDSEETVLFMSDPFGTLGQYEYYTELTESLPHADTAALNTFNLVTSPVAIADTAFATNKPTDYVVVRDTLFAIVGITSGAGPNNKVYYSIVPTDAGGNNFSGPLVAGAALTPLINSVAANDFLFVFNQEAGYNINAAQDVAEVLWHFKNRPSPSNYKYICTDGYFFYYTVGTDAFAYDPNTGANISMNISRRESFSCNEILGLAADERFVYILANINVEQIGISGVALLAAYPSTDTEGVWNLEVLWQDTTGTRVHSNLAAFPEADTRSTRLYWGTVITGDDITVTSSMVIPANWDASGGDSFETTGSLYTSITHANFPGFIKRAMWISLSGLLDSNNYIAVYYSMDEGDTWTQLDFNTSTGGIQNAVSSPAIGSLENDSSRNIMVRFDFVGNGTNTSVLSEFDLHQRVQFRYLQAITCGVRVADNLSLRNGTIDRNRTREQIKEDLETVRASTEPITYTDFLGNSFIVTVDKIDYVPSRDEKPTDNWEIEAVVSLTRADYGN